MKFVLNMTKKLRTYGLRELDSLLLTLYLFQHFFIYHFYFPTKLEELTGLDSLIYNYFLNQKNFVSKKCTTSSHHN